MKLVEEFVSSLAKFDSVFKDVVNPYQSSIQRFNIELYLQMMLALQPRFLLVGEALGYRGGALTGVPFTSEWVLHEQRPFASRPFQTIGQQKEATATIVWHTLNQMNIVPLCWNAFPFHPHKPHSVYSNRRPKKPELLSGHTFLLQLLALFRIEKMIAVGRVAETVLASLPYPVYSVRHPAYGGKQDFQEGLQMIFDL